MRFASKWIFIFLTLLMSAGAVWSAPTPEQRARDAAEDSFRLGLWERAEKRYADFVEQFPKSEDRSLAVLRQAQARLKQGKFTNAMELLSVRQRDPGRLADEFQFWLGEALFQCTNYPAAADAYAKLTRSFTNSPRVLEASFDEALARSKLGDWAKVNDLLLQSDGAFQLAALRDPTNEIVARGALLLGEAQLAQNNLRAAEETLRLLANQNLGTELDWRRQYLLCRVQLAAGRLPEALQTTSNLTTLAVTAGRRNLQVETSLLRGGILEQQKRFDEAIAAYESNLSDDLPTERRRQAVLKIVELLLARNKVAAAAQRLEKFLGDYSKDMVVDVAFLTVGELHLKEYLALADTNHVDLMLTNATKAFPSYSNHLQQAYLQFEWIVKNFPRSQVLGKALLDRAWCLWINGQITESQTAFQQAAERLPASADQAVARYKWADCQMLEGDYSGALTNYFSVLSNYTAFPAVKEELLEPVLYQIVRASLVQTNMEVATNAIGKILAYYPDGFYCDRAMLLTGEKLSRAGNPAQARDIFSAALKLPEISLLAPEIRLAVGRTYEQEKAWPLAVAEYDRWLTDYADKPSRPQVEYARAWDVWRAGQAANALADFSTFVVKYPSNELAPLAQNWVADYYLQQGNYTNAEANYQLLFQKWPPSALTYSARLMAGRAAMARQGYEEAVGYFAKLINDNACPPDFMAQAWFEYGDATTRMEPTEMESPLTNYWRAITIFGKIPQLYPASDLVPLAWGRIGACYMQLGAQNPTYYSNAVSTYQRTMDTPAANITTRSIAEFGIGVVLEKQAALKPVGEQSALMKQAFERYLNVALSSNLRSQEQADPFWVRKAGVEAARLAETLGEWPQAISLYQRLSDQLPPLKGQMEKKIARVREHLNSEGN